MELQVDISTQSINPYRDRIDSYPGRLFPVEGGDIALQRGLLQDAIAGFDAVVVELGSGSGKHLLARAASEPNVAYIGLELRYKRCVRTIEKAVLQGLENVFVLRCDAAAIEALFAPAQIREFHVNFPDPWAKPRNHKHRMLGPQFLDRASRLLVDEGAIFSKTDHEEYYRSFLAAIESDVRYAVLAATDDLHHSEYIHQSVRTEFEDLFLSQGLPVYFVQLKLQSRT